MATIRDYVEYLNDQVDIAPANSQEELQAAEVIQQLMEQHRLETRVQEFDAPSSGTLPYRIVMLLLALGVVLSGIYGTPAAAVGVVLVFVSAALFLLKLLGYDLLSNLGPRARSQNVIGVHRAEGPLVVKGNRPIVIVAHYDTPHESFLYAPGIARFLPLLRRISPICIAVVSVLGIFQLLGFVPVIARRVLWVVGIIAALPLLALAVEAIASRFSACTEGANDNKSSVAAMLGVLDKVRPGSDAASGFAQAQDERRAAAQAAAAARAEEEAKARAEALARAQAEAAAKAEAAGLEQAEAEDGYLGDEFDDGLELDELDYDDELEEPDDFELVGDLDEPQPEQRFAVVPGPEGEPAEMGEPDEAAYDDEELVGDAADEAYEDEAYEDEAFEDGYGFDDEELTDEELDDETAEDGFVEEPLSFGFGAVLIEDAEYEVIDDEEYFEGAEDAFDDAFGEDDGADDYADDGLEDTFDDDLEDAEFAEDDADESFSPAYGEPASESLPEDVEAFGPAGSSAKPEPSVAAYEQDEDEAEAVPAAFVPSFARVRAEQDEAPVAKAAPPAEVAPQVVTDRYEEVVGVRHGREVIESLRMLPISCELEYVEPRLVSRTVRPQDELDRAEFGVISPDGDESWEPFLRPTRVRKQRRDEGPSLAETGKSVMEKVGGFFGRLRDQLFGGEQGDEGYDDYADGAYDDEYDEAYGDDEAYDEDFSALADEAYAEYEKQQGVSAAAAYDDYAEYEEYAEGDAELADEESEADFDDELDAYAEDDGYIEDAEEALGEEAMEDTSSLSPLVPGITFTDEPLPTDAEIDLMDGSGLTEVVEDDLGSTLPQVVAPAPKAEGVDDPMWGVSEFQPPARSIGQRAALFDLPDPYAASGDPFDTDPGDTVRSRLRLVDEDDEGDGHWKGGATTRVGLREDEAQEVADDAELPEEAAQEAGLDEAALDEQAELRDAILSMGDDELLAHDIWFVALGASELNHAGMTAFLREYRSKIRGAFMVNLSCVGAGTLSLLTREGSSGRRTDRRVMRMLGNIADDLHIETQRADYSWDETDATQAARKHVRALTIMGMENGVPALSHTADDVADEVDARQVADVAAMVAELIRRA